MVRYGKIIMGENIKVKILGYCCFLREVLPSYEVVCIQGEKDSVAKIELCYKGSNSSKKHVASIDNNYGVKWISKGAPTRLRNIIKNSLMHYAIQNF